MPNEHPRECHPPLLSPFRSSAFPSDLNLNLRPRRPQRIQIDAHTRPFATIGWNVSEIGLGTWQLGADWGDVRDDEAIAILRAAADSGVNFFDTADVYGLGRSESLIARFLAERGRKDFYVATKMGRFPQPGWPDNFRLDVMRQHVDASANRLGVETLDLTQLHCIPTDELRRGDVFDHLRTLQKEGRIQTKLASVYPRIKV